jgi:peptidoglycan hydrolase-like protein with peptidoglycan-binding domain
MNTESTNTPTPDDADMSSADTTEAIIAEVTEEVVEVEVVPAPAPVPAPTQPSPSAVVGTGDRDDVLLSRCEFKSKATRKSLSVHHLQRRLAELGFPDAGTDKDGWYGDLTRLAVSQFQTARNLDGDGLMNAATLAAIFDGDHNVNVVVD